MSELTLEQKLQAMRDKFRSSLVDRLADIDQAWQTACDGDEEARVTLHRMAHSLAGSGATFGLAKVSEVSKALERSLETVTAGNEIANSVEVKDLLDEVRRVITDAAGEEGGATDEDAVTISSRSIDNKRLVYVAEDAREESDNLAEQIGHFGYEVETFQHTDELFAAVKKKIPVAIVTDVVFENGNHAGIEVVERITAEISNDIPVFFVSTLDDIMSRLRAVRAGGLAFLNKPVDAGVFVDQLDALSSDELPEPIRVLIVDDEESMTEYYRAILEAVGMKVVTVNDPLLVMESLVSFLPEIVLMDLYMPSCSGLELAKVIRQQEAFVSLPIVYLSSEGDKGLQLEAMSAGGDDFLTKPIVPDHLIGAVTNRVHRWRILRSYMVRDSLTGLYNHTKTKEMLDVEMTRAARQNSGLFYAMVDIDKFKLVNDTYGHPTGDRVIKSLLRLLQQRLRKVDIVGRVGGEEFAVILVDTDAENAVRVLNEMREHFTALVHHSGEIEFHSAFSCGVASFEDFETAQDLNEAADRALYAAKEGGRNQVVLARADK
jgi:diguanylate cyclase (GGDEF)-like protein